MPTRILIADAHALVREGLKQLVRDVVPDALPVLCDDLHALLTDADDGADFAAAIVAHSPRERCRSRDVLRRTVQRRP